MNDSSSPLSEPEADIRDTTGEQPSVDSNKTDLDKKTSEARPRADAPDRAARRAFVGVILEFIGMAAVVVLLSRIFLETWVAATAQHWTLLGVSGLCVVGFLICVSAMFHQERGIAVLGVWLGILGSLAAAICGTMLLAAVLELWGTRPMADLIASTEEVLEQVHVDCQKFINDNQAAPTNDEGMSLLDGRTDAWGVPLRYLRKGVLSYEIISAGPDRTHGDADDLRKVF